MRSLTKRFAFAATAAAVTVVFGAAGVANAHEERPTQGVDGTGSRLAYRADGPRLLVCKTDAVAFQSAIVEFSAALAATNNQLWNECQRNGFRHLQDAVDAAVQPSTRIMVLPGTYLEEPSLAPPTGTCAALPARYSRNHLYQVLSYEQQVACPHNQNLVAVLGKKNLQIEGTGAKPTDVIVDAQFQRLNAIRADRSDGFYIRNLTVQRTTFNALYIMESDGFVIDTVVGRWTNEYGFLTFAVDHGLYTNCEAYGNGDSGLYPGAAHDINRDRGDDVSRYAVEIRDCRSHHNALGYSGTAGDSVWVHDSEFTDNSVGVATDSLFPNHPGLPQNHALFERNVIGHNNSDYLANVRDGTCARPVTERRIEEGVVCPKIAPVVGTGVMIAGGNYDVFRDNWIYGNRAYAYMGLWVPGFVREDYGFAAQFDTSHHIRFFNNHLGVDPAGVADPNGQDYWWDGQGVGSCWQAPSSGSEPVAMPRCDADGLSVGPGVQRFLSEPAKTLKAYVCLSYSNVLTNTLASNCDWYGARGLQRIEVQYAVGEAALLALVLFVLWVRVLRRSRAASVGLLAGLAGLVVGVAGTVYEATPLTPIGLALLAAGWLVVGTVLRGRGRRGLAWLTLAVGVLGLLGAIDRGLWMLPYLPFPPTYPRIVAELVWVPWALVVAGRRRSPSVEVCEDREDAPVVTAGARQVELAKDVLDVGSDRG